MSAPGRRAAARIAWRQARKAPWRTALVVATVALPVAALSAGLILIKSGVPTAEQRATEAMGSADLIVHDFGTASPGGRPAARVAAAFPPGTDVVVSRTTVMESNVDGTFVSMTISEWSRPIDAPPVRGIYAIQAGRAPSAANEAALHAVHLRALEAEVGDEVDLLGRGVGVRITGEVAHPGQLNEPIAVVGPGTLKGVDEVYPDRFLVDLPSGASVGDATLAFLDAYPQAFVADRVNAAEGDGQAALVASAAAFGGTALALFGTGLVAAAAFVLGARRQLRTLGLVGAAGGEPRQVRRVVLMGGIVLGALGSVTGLLVGLGLVVAVQGKLDGWAGRLILPLEFPVPWLAGSLLLGTLAATLAAYGPARSAGRLSTMDALAGRSAPPKPPGRLARRGVALLVIATAALVGTTIVRSIPGLIASLIAMVCGFLLAIPLVASLVGRLGGPLPASLRLAARDVARHGRRTGAALAAATMVLALPVAVGGFTLSEEAFASSGVPPLAPDHLLVVQTTAGLDAEPEGRDLVAAIRAAVGDAVVVELRGAHYPKGTETQAGTRLEEPSMVFVHGPQVVEEDGAAYNVTGALLVGGEDLLYALHAEDGLDALQAGKVVAVGPGGTEDGSVELAGPDGESTRRRLPAVEAGETRYSSVGFGGEYVYVISPETAASLGMVARSDPYQGYLWLVRAASDLDDEAVQAAQDAAARHPSAYVSSANQLSASNRTNLVWILTAAAGVVALAIVGVVVALVTAESRRDHAILVAVGAGPSMRRKVVGANAWLLGTLGGLLAVPAGFLPVVVIQLARQAGRTVVVPWVAIGVALLAVPLVAAAVSAAVSRQPRAAQLLRPIA